MVLNVLQMEYRVTGGSGNTCMGVQCSAQSAGQLPEGYSQFVTATSSGIEPVSFCVCVCACVDCVHAYIGRQGGSVGRVSDSRSKDRRFESHLRQEHKKNL